MKAWNQKQTNIFVAWASHDHEIGLGHDEIRWYTKQGVQHQYFSHVQ